MPPIRRPRVGNPVTVKGRTIQFSYWPTYRTSRRPGLHSRVYATNPWAIIQVAIRERCPAAAKPEALASLDQAEFFYRSSVGSREWAAKPLPLYYAFMNLVKAFALTRAIRTTFDKAQHGISEKLGAGGRELYDASLEVFPSPGVRGPNLFADFAAALGSTPYAANTNYPLLKLLPQIVPGHRIWCDAANEEERFIAIDSIPFSYTSTPKEMWATIRISEDDPDRVGKTRAEVLTESRLRPLFRAVQNHTENGRTYIQLEQSTPTIYTHRTADRLESVVSLLRPFIWSTAITLRPFRRYYLYTSPTADHPFVVPQLLSIYAVAYYLGSITRYRPQHFAKILAGDFGEFVQEFLSGQPSQFLYLMASDFAKRDVARAPLV